MTARELSGDNVSIGGSLMGTKPLRHSLRDISLYIRPSNLMAGFITERQGGTDKMLPMKSAVID